MPEGNAEQVVVRGKTVIWIARYSQILTFLLAQAISVVACVSLFLMLTGDRQLEEVEVSETVVMVGCGFLSLVISVIYMLVIVRVKFLKALQLYQDSDDSPALPIRIDQPLSQPLETLLRAFTSATHRSQAFFFTSATINLILVYFDESWLHLFLAFTAVLFACLADTYCRSSCEIHSARAGHEAGKQVSL